MHDNTETFHTIWQPFLSCTKNKNKRLHLTPLKNCYPSKLFNKVKTLRFYLHLKTSDSRYLNCYFQTSFSIYIYISGGPLSALTCCVNARLLSAIKKISPLIYSQSWVGSWVYTTHYDDFHPDILARMYT